MENWGHVPKSQFSAKARDMFRNRRFWRRVPGFLGPSPLAIPKDTVLFFRSTLERSPTNMSERAPFRLRRVLLGAPDTPQRRHIPICDEEVGNGGSQW